MSSQASYKPSIFDSKALERSQRLAELVRSEIEGNAGRVSFAHFMERALYTPHLGYYNSEGRKFGEAGDFVTAPEISPLLARCIARQSQQALEALGNGDILEFGAGSGTMACDLLQELEALHCLPRQYLILELSAELKTQQKALIKERVPHLQERVTWLEALPPRGFRGVILANEVLDAMPVHVLRLGTPSPSEYYVGCEGNRFTWQAGPLSDPGLDEHLEAILRTTDEDLPSGFTCEISLAIPAWIKSIAASLEQGMVLLSDFGFPRHELYHRDRSNGTLMCYYRHRAHSDPLQWIGLQDISAHVDFTAVAEAAHASGLSVAGYASQAHFLLSCGLAGMVEEHTANLEEYFRLSQQVKRLTLPQAMGELFKVLALTKGIKGPLLGFTWKDERFRL